MAQSNNRRSWWIWTSVLILLACVTVTTIAFFYRLDGFLPDDTDAISLIPEIPIHMDTEGSGTTATPSPSTQAPTVPTAAPTTRPPKQPAFEAEDAARAWSTDTQVDLFRVSYENGERVVTVNSDNGDTLIAPGTQNSYTFKLKNTGNAALDYTVEVDAFFTPADITIPITGRLNRYDGAWIVGGSEDYQSVAELDAAQDKATLGAGKYTYYTLDWVWPFDSGDDEWDTLLGNLATGEDLTFTLMIKTTASESTNPFDNSGITPPQTGEHTNYTQWTLLAVGAFAVMVCMLLAPKREKAHDDTEAEKT